MECFGRGEGGREPLADDLEDLGGLAHAARRVHVRELALAAGRGRIFESKFGGNFRCDGYLFVASEVMYPK